MAHRPEKREEIRSSWARGSDAEPVPGVPHLPRNRDTKPDGENTIQRNHPRSQDIRQLPSRPGHRRQTTNFVKLWVMTRLRQPVVPVFHPCVRCDDMPAGFKVADDVFWGTNGAVEAYVIELADLSVAAFGQNDPLTAYFQEQRDGFFGEVLFTLTTFLWMWRDGTGS